MRRVLAVSTVLFAALAAPALGGGFATTGLSSLPDGTAPGEPWVGDVTVLAPGRTPLPGMKPQITISRGSEERSFPAKPIRTGVYRAEVVFPDAGRWAYEVDSGYGLGPETFAPVDIRRSGAAAATPVDIRRSDAAAATRGDGDSRWLGALGAGLLAGLITAVATRRRPRRGPLPA
jgi:hypothetical protein